MKCMLIFPAWKTSDFFPEEFGSSTTHRWHPLGLLYIGASLLKQGHDVKLLDGAFWTHQEILQVFQDFKPEFVGVHANCPMWTKAMQTVNDLRELSSDVFIAVGGPAAIGWRQKCLEQCMAIDCIFTGEGEVTVPEVAEQLESGSRQALADIKGIIYRDKSGNISINPDSCPVADLDTLPFPAFELLGDMAINYRPNIGTFLKLPVFSMISSRDCSHGKCIFCFHTHTSNKTRFRSPKNVVDEMEYIVNTYGAKEIKFLDDTFTADKERVHAICDEIRRRKIKVAWFISSRVDAVDRDILEDMKNAGCYSILFGVESGVQKNLDSLNKGTTVEQIKKAVRAAKSVGLKVSTPFIFGIPGETYEEGLETIKFAIELNSDLVNFHTLTPFPGTELYDNVEKYGTMTDETNALTFETGAFVPYTMTQDEILKLKEMAFKRYYCRAAYIFKRLLSIRSIYDIISLFYGAKTLFVLLMHPGIFKKEGQKTRMTK